MPHASDKIIINGNGVRGRYLAIEAEFDTARMLGAEIVKKGWAPETTALRDEMAPECVKVDRALDDYLAFMRKFNAKLAAFIDNHP